MKHAKTSQTIATYAMLGAAAIASLGLLAKCMKPVLHNYESSVVYNDTNCDGLYDEFYHEYVTDGVAFRTTPIKNVRLSKTYVLSYPLVPRDTVIFNDCQEKANSK